jgi:hypothetical protein
LNKQPQTVYRSGFAAVGLDKGLEALDHEILAYYKKNHGVLNFNGFCGMTLRNRKKDGVCTGHL